ncbi:MAG: DNA-binding transcription factor yap1 [Cirrosporium novae-zelandiae]|nr:MAG: DNA-binding transcription factor yap1 [Cirrosporium novae-zelandiae]
MAAGPRTNNFGDNITDFYLSPNQQDLLLNALSTNNHSSGYRGNSLPNSGQKQSGPGLETSQLTKTNPQPSVGAAQIYESPQLQNFPSGQLSNMSQDESPLLDYDYEFNADGSFDFDLQNGDRMIGELPSTSSLHEDDKDKDLHDKRKSIDGQGSDEGGGKRVQGDEKAAKKPGRKLLTSEPTSKRKAQNRAAQRAFRERKEKHLKDLETKVEELEKASESTNHENGLLRAQVERLQIELREYRKRLSLTGGGLARFSPNSGPIGGPIRNNSTGNNFQFEFPKFGDLPGAHIFNNGQLAKESNLKSQKTPNVSTFGYKAPGVVNRGSSSSASPGATPSSTNGTRDQRENSASQQSGTPGLQNGNAGTNPNGLPDIFNLNGGNRNISFDYLSRNNSLNSLHNNNQSRYQHNNSSSNSTSTDSPSASSVSQHGPGSSVCTSPESTGPSMNGCKPGDNCLDTINEHGDSTGEMSFCEKLNMACGNLNNPVPRAMSRSNDSSTVPFGTAKTPLADINGIDWLAQQNGGQFDPVLFGDYRETQDHLAANNFSNFFDDAFPLPDLGSPFNFEDAISSPNQHPRRDLMKEVEAAQNADDAEEVVPGEDLSKMLPCNKIWDRLQHNEKFQSGELDVDSLCTELRNKAKCSESGVVVNEKVVDDLLERVTRNKATSSV